jgi:two-component system LytT family response regulator
VSREDDAELTAVVAEDEPLVREMFLELLAELPGVRVVAACKDGLEAVLAVQAHAPDVLFLDVEMPKLDGFEVLGLLDRPVSVVFVTAYDSYAVRAFEAAAIDYLLKPFGIERLAQSLDRVRAARRQGRMASAPGERLRKTARPEAPWVDRLAVKDGSEIGVIPVEELRFARSEDDYVRLGTKKREWLKHQALSALEESLNPSMFVRIHRTCIVNVACVTRVEAETRDRFSVFLDDGTSLPASRQGERRLREVLGL